MSKFNLGDKVYCIRRGLGTVVGTESLSGPLTCVHFDTTSTHFYLEDGKSSCEDVNPTLLTLQEARDRGYAVPKRKVTKTLVQYANLYPKGDMFCYRTEFSANDSAGEDRIACVKLTGTYEVEE